jgi:hypothetical protein
VSDLKTQKSGKKFKKKTNLKIDAKVQRWGIQNDDISSEEWDVDGVPFFSLNYFRNTSVRHEMTKLLYSNNASIK